MSGHRYIVGVKDRAAVAAAKDYFTQNSNTPSMKAKTPYTFLKAPTLNIKPQEALERLTKEFNQSSKKCQKAIDLLGPRDDISPKDFRRLQQVIPLMKDQDVRSSHRSSARHMSSYETSAKDIRKKSLSSLDPVISKAQAPKPLNDISPVGLTSVGLAPGSARKQTLNMDVVQNASPNAHDRNRSVAAQSVELPQINTNHQMNRNLNLSPTIGSPPLPAQRYSRHTLETKPEENRFSTLVQKSGKKQNFLPHQRSLKSLVDASGLATARNLETPKSDRDYTKKGQMLEAQHDKFWGSVIKEDVRRFNHDNERKKMENIRKAGDLQNYLQAQISAKNSEKEQFKRHTRQQGLSEITRAQNIQKRVDEHTVSQQEYLRGLQASNLKEHELKHRKIRDYESVEKKKFKAMAQQQDRIQALITAKNKSDNQNVQRLFRHQMDAVKEDHDTRQRYEKSPAEKLRAAEHLNLSPKQFEKVKLISKNEDMTNAVNPEAGGLISALVSNSYSTNQIQKVKALGQKVEHFATKAYPVNSTIMKQPDKKFPTTASTGKLIEMLEKDQQRVIDNTKVTGTVQRQNVAAHDHRKIKEKFHKNVEIEQDQKVNKYIEKIERAHNEAEAFQHSMKKVQMKHNLHESTQHTMAGELKQTGQVILSEMKLNKDRVPNEIQFGGDVTTQPYVKHILEQKAINGNNRVHVGQANLRAMHD